MALTQITTKGIKDGTIIGADLTTNVDLVDNQKIRFGTGNDLEIFHDGSHSRIIDTGTGDLKLQTNFLSIVNAGNTEHMAKFIENGAVELYHNDSKKFHTYSEGCSIFGNLNLEDSTSSSNGRLRLGNSSDLQIYHDGSHARFHNSTGLISMQASGYRFNDALGIENCLDIDANGAVSLYFDHSKKFETANYGALVSGQLYVNDYIYIDNQADLYLEDNGKARFGNSSDLQIFHDGHSRIKHDGAGVLSIQGDDVRIHDISANEFLAKFVQGGAVELYHNNVKKFHTRSDGCQVTGILRTGDDGATSALMVGASDDLQIFHDGSNSIINDTGTGQLQIASNALRINNAANNENMIAADENSEVRIYHDNVEKLKTTSSGVTVTGTVSETSDIALKSDIQPLTNTLEKIQQITGYKYNLINSTSSSMGVIAQDVEKVFPELVHGSEGNKTLQYSGLIGVLVEAIKDLSAKVASLEAT